MIMFVKEKMCELLRVSTAGQRCKNETESTQFGGRCETV